MQGEKKPCGWHKFDVTNQEKVIIDFNYFSNTRNSYFIVWCYNTNSIRTLNLQTDSK